jgi:glucose/arabinose dehydrogenase/plastocyanin
VIFSITILNKDNTMKFYFILLPLIFFLVVLSITFSSNFTKPFTLFSTLSNKAFAQYAIAPISPAGPTINDPNLKAQLVFPPTTKGYTSMAFLGPNDILVLEKNTGKVNRIVNGKMQSKPVLDVDVANKIERGLLGIAVAPSLTSDGKRYVFLFYTQAGENTDGDEFRGLAPAEGNMVYRYEFAKGKLINPELLLQLPANPGTTGRPDHNGGKLAIGPDGNVYAVIGEVGGHQTQAMNIINGPPPDGTGGIMRISQEGQSVTNSLFGDEPPLSYYFAYGVRNSFGIAFDPVSGKLWDTENGPNYGDEINLVEPGFNSGWSMIQGYAKDSHLGHTNPSDLVYLSKNAKYSDPAFEWADPVGPTAITFLNSDKLGAQYQNDMFVGDINNGNLYHFKLTADRTKLLYPNGQPIENIAITSSQIPILRFGLGLGGITDLQTGPDGFLYILVNNGAIFRIVPASFAAANPTLYSITSNSSTDQLEGKEDQSKQQKSNIPSNSGQDMALDSKNKVTIVGVRDLQSYEPNPINIKVGDTVTWINVDVISHTVTSGKDYNPVTSGKMFNSGSIISNGVYNLKFTKAGVFDYFCLFHPDMKGQIIVSR